MESTFGHRKTASSDRLLGVPILPPSPSQSEDDLNEDDIFYTAIPDPTPPKTLTKKPFTRPESFGILEALPEFDLPHLIFHHKPSISPSASRMIPIPPRPNGSSNFNHSAPVNVPPISRDLRRDCDFDEVDFDDQEGDMLPPHEMVAHSYALSTPKLSSSVLEGAGRTLKGRDLRSVRNAVWRKTGFLHEGI